MTGIVVWLTGRPASGKSTLAAAVAQRLLARGETPLVLDGDAVRGALVPEPGYEPAARDGFYRTLGNLAVLAARQGHVVLVPATAHLRRWRDLARIAAPRFAEVYVATPGAECARRDPKGLYRGGVPDLPGADLPYEEPASPEVLAPHGLDATAVDAILAIIGPPA